MDCRRVAVVVMFGLAFAASGCQWGRGQKTAQNIERSNLPVPVPDNVVVKKESPATKRQPSVNLMTKAALMREGQADKEESPDSRTRLLDEARKLYQDALKAEPNHQEALHGLGRVYVKLADYDRAADTYRAGLAKNPKSAVLWVDLAMCHNRQKNFPEAIHCLQKALEADPENRDIMKTMGFTLARAGQTDQALTFLTRSMGPANAHYNLARMLLHLNQHERGLHHLQLALQANPDLREARELLASLEKSPPASPRDSAEAIAPGQ